ncbi:formate transporter [Brachybacterium sp. P6-10-X1]|uniref:formate/nitrite transporter family protein n=1 Tax=Brachybacterium sp. P6-10-X1 TaxID=1903186 RepID=UPI0009718E40|nr:formate/nitrite transporter family protein [Brachybacterium sp. P6-10-X1]APX32172.1 formate transporter [Brachybacterium sp. P6-10-X1]
MSYVKPADLVTRMIDAGAGKLGLSARDAVLRAAMGGALLTLGAAFAVTVTVQTGEALLGAVLFPIGFILLYLLGYDLLTGVFTLAPLALIARRPGASIRRILRLWALVFLGNLLGAVAVALVMTVCFTYAFSAEPSAVGLEIREIGHGRTVGYAEHGAAGMLTLFVRAVLCNVMVSTGVIAAMMSDNLLGKAVAMWMPVTLFFYMGFEHSVVNMFLFPAGLLLGADFTLTDYLLWNEIPTVLGNLVGGIVFVGLALYITHHRPAPSTGPAPPTGPATTPEPVAASESLVAVR